MAPSRHDWKIVDWDVKPQHNQQPIYTKKINKQKRLEPPILAYSIGLKRWLLDNIGDSSHFSGYLLGYGETSHGFADHDM